MRTGNVTKDIIGERGEWIFATLMTKYLPGHGFLFRPNFLGDKWPHTDFIVVLLDAGPTIAPFFFVQVKATTAGYTHNKNRLKVGVKATGVAGLAAYPAPSYIAGIDVDQERGFLVSANEGTQAALPSMSTAHPINDATRLALWSEVDTFWRNHGSPRLVSSLRDPDWK